MIRLLYPKVHWGHVYGKQKLTFIYTQIDTHTGFSFAKTSGWKGWFSILGFGFEIR